MRGAQSLAQSWRSWNVKKEAFIPWAKERFSRPVELSVPKTFTRKLFTHCTFEFFAFIFGDNEIICYLKAKKARKSRDGFLRGVTACWLLERAFVPKLCTGTDMFPLSHSSLHSPNPCSPGNLG
jgi:hypothetical protein